jgi:hypothetical protein
MVSTNVIPAFLVAILSRRAFPSVLSKRQKGRDTPPQERQYPTHFVRGCGLRTDGKTVRTREQLERTQRDRVRDHDMIQYRIGETGDVCNDDRYPRVTVAGWCQRKDDTISKLFFLIALTKEVHTRLRLSVPPLSVSRHQHVAGPPSGTSRQLLYAVLP